MGRLVYASSQFECSHCRFVYIFRLKKHIEPLPSSANRKSHARRRLSTMSYYGPYDYFPVHSRYGPPDLRPPELRDLRMLPQDLHPVDIPHHEDAWGYGPPPPAPPPMYPPHHPTPPPPHYTAFDPIPYEAPIVVPDRPSSNIGNSFAIPKGSRNAMNRAAPAAETPSIVGANGSRTHSAKLNAQSVGATIAAPRKPAKGATTRPPPLKIKCERKDSPSGSTSPTARSGSSSATAPDSCASPVPNVIPAQYLVAPPTWKRMFETARARDPEEVGVAAPVVELASQMLNKRCMQLVAGDPPRRRFHMVVDSSILKKGVLSARSNEAMTVALYLFQLSKGVTNNGELVSTETMLCKMRIFVGDTRLLVCPYLVLLVAVIQSLYSATITAGRGHVQWRSNQPFTSINARDFRTKECSHCD
ncbi:hypothetical protein BC832DRAFT_67664 [Gaertneriomyces semiglobifer]|nr:hypothetical protein BC832DRAFT_67664 [Gaertneriomyces semiglobifer]